MTIETVVNGAPSAKDGAPEILRLVKGRPPAPYLDFFRSIVADRDLLADLS